jgi:hypothetical protein
MSDDPLTRDERDYFNRKEAERMGDHDLLMKHDAVLFAPATGLATTVLRDTVTLYGDGTEEHPGIVNVLYNHIRNQEKTDKKRYQNLTIYIGVIGALAILVDPILRVLKVIP